MARLLSNVHVAQCCAFANGDPQWCRDETVRAIFLCVAMKISSCTRLQLEDCLHSFGEDSGKWCNGQQPDFRVNKRAVLFSTVAPTCRRSSVHCALPSVEGIIATKSGVERNEMVGNDPWFVWNTECLWDA